MTPNPAAHNDPLRHPSFNNVDLRELLDESQGIAELHLERDGRTFEVWVWGSRTTITMEQLEAVAPLADRLVELDRRLLATVAESYADGSEDAVVTFGEEHADADVMSIDTLKKIFGDQPRTPENVIAKVRFMRASIFADPDEQLGIPEGQAAVFDYGLGLDVSQYVLAVSIDINGDILSISMES
jgi:hypothetical protein